MFNISTSINFIENHIERWSIKSYLSTSRNLFSVLESPKEVATTLLIFELLKSHLSNQKLQEILTYLNSQIDTDWTFHFFEDKSLLPNDVDTTSRWLSTLFDSWIISFEEISKQAKRIVENVDGNWIIQTYYNEYKRSRESDPTALLNIVRFLCKAHIDKNNFQPTVNFLERYIESESYEKPNRYYFSSITFLYFMMRLASYNDSFKDRLYNIMRNKTISIYWSIDLSMLIKIKQFLNIDADDDIKRLIGSRRDNWSFPYDSIYKYGSKDMYFWSQVISTAFAINSLL